jgi:hypothetical protein
MVVFILSRHAQDVKCVIVSQQALPRLQIPRRYLQGYVDLLRADVPLVPSELIFNPNEMDLSDWEERKPTPILISAESENRRLHYRVEHGMRHQTLMCCISASGDAYCPVLQSVNRGVLAIFDRGVWGNIDLEIKLADSPYMTDDIFIEYLCNALIPAVERNRRLPGCLNKPAILFCDNCVCHYNEKVLKE